MELIELTKICNKCGERKRLKEFSKSIKGRFGAHVWCKVCAHSYYKKYYKRDENKEKIAARGRLTKTKICTKCGKRKSWLEFGKQKLGLYGLSGWCKNCKNFYSIKLYNRDGKAKAKANIRIKNKYKTDPMFRLSVCMSRGVRGSLKNKNSNKNGHHWETLVPYNLNDLIKRLKKTLPKGYVWDSYINGKTDLHIDHIIPISAHNFTSYEHIDFQRCWALKNLKLLPASKNMSKGAKLEKSFQPSLLL